MMVTINSQVWKGRLNQWMEAWPWLGYVPIENTRCCELPSLTVLWPQTPAQFQMPTTNRRPNAPPPCNLQLGVHGYAFLNTNNGYILSHPDLRPLQMATDDRQQSTFRRTQGLIRPGFNQLIHSVDLLRAEPHGAYREGKKLKPKPNYNSVDLSEVEWEDRAESLRTAMINRETGSFSMDVKVPLDKGPIFTHCNPR
ncbi:Voltage-dependent calcium channel subunit alpha-2/delta-4 [Saguinus oedipus]|uniref:Voltage-dependent calcium channel subunit alpha-2/delta-4 n=1 Tax=Saguinus oedipus TaxID=9490 RepID=A0ABQ9UY65_SAGOE|nr:Voltage-dependent calcium channel subunit alpha-2/delta-4 [Saguinus oedipus]